MSNIFDIFKSLAKEKNSTLSGAPDFVIACLGNPGRQYEFTRHNAGFLCADYMSDKYCVKIDRLKFRSLCGEIVLGGKKAVIIKPQTYMNLSGEAVGEALSYYKLDPKTQLLVIYDDIYLDVGRLRIRQKGSSGGQKGVESIIKQIGTDEFQRIRIGIGKPPAGYDLSAWVLGKIPESDRDAFLESLKRADIAAELILQGKFSEALSKHNS